MGDVAAKIKIMPESVDTDLAELKEKLKAQFRQEPNFMETSSKSLSLSD